MPVVRVTFLDIAREVAAEFRLVLTDHAAMDVLWEYTGYPSFWRGDPEAECRRQLREHFTEVVAW